MTSSLEKARAKSAETRNALHPPKALPVIHLLRDIRVAKGLTQGDLSKISGYSQTHISIIENGHKIPKLTCLRDLAEALGYEITLTPKGSPDGRFR